MENSGLIKALKTFSKNEIKEFGRYVDSPFHNGRKELSKFYGIIKKHYPDFRGSAMNEETLYSKLYPGKKYDERVIRRLSSFLMKLVESYLTYVGLQKDNYTLKKSFLKEAGKRNLTRVYEKQLIELEKEYSNFIPPAEEYFLRKYYIVEDKLNNYLYKTKDASIADDIENHSLYLIEFLLVQIYQSRYNLFLYEKEFQADYSESVFMELFSQMDFQKILKKVKDKDPENYPVIAIYYYELMALLEGNESIEIFKRLLKDNANKFSWLEKRNFYYIFVSICSLQIEKGEGKYKAELLNAYKEMLDLGICSDYEGGYFSAKLFRNIVAAANITREYEWLEDFINRYSGYLAPDDKDNMYSLSMALLNYEKGEYGKTLECILNIDVELVHFKIDVRYLTVKTYYELGYYEQLLSSIDAFRHFLSNDKHISGRIVDVYSRFCSLTGRLAKIRIEKAYDRLPGIKKEILSLDNKANSEWLMSKANEIGE